MSGGFVTFLMAVAVLWSLATWAFGGCDDDDLL